MKKTPSLLLAAVTIAGLLAVVPSTAQAALGEWDLPITISNSGATSSEPQIVADGTTITAIWTQLDGSDYVVQAASSSDGGASWSAPTAVSAVSQFASKPQIVTNGAVTTAIWLRFDGSNPRVQAASSVNDGTTWSTPVNLSAVGEPAFEPELVRSGATITAAWVTLDGSIKAASSADGMTWSTLTTVAGLGAGASNPQLVTNGTTITAAWMSFVGGNFRIQAASSLNGGVNWSAPADLSTAGLNAFNPQIVTDGATITAIWHRSDRVQAASSVDGTTWSVPVTVALPSGALRDPQLANVGTTVVAILIGPDNRLQASSSTNGSAWTTPIAVSDNMQSASSAQLVSDGSTVTAIWNRFDGTTYLIETASSADGGATWSSPTTLSDTSEAAFSPQLVTDGRTITAIWDRLDGSTREIQVASISEPPTVSRLAGADRYETAVVISNEFDPDVPVVYLATGTNYPDALSAASAAAFQGGPLLLTTPTTLPQLVRDELVRLNPGLVVIVGGTGVVSTAVEAQVVAALPTTVTVRRDAGDNRYETSRIIAEKAFPAGQTTIAFVATGTNFPDALSASAAAGVAGAPVILVDGAGSSIDVDTQGLISDFGVGEIFIAGGTGVVSEAIEDALGLVVGPTNVTRLSGVDRYATSVAINNARFTTTPTVFLATGLGFADALAGAALAGGVGAPLYVVPGTCVPAPVIAELNRLQTTQVVLLGGTGVLTVDVANLIRC